MDTDILHPFRSAWKAEEEGTRQFIQDNPKLIAKGTLNQCQETQPISVHTEYSEHVAPMSHIDYELRDWFHPFPSSHKF
jgi:hypothetical protein